MSVLGTFAVVFLWCFFGFIGMGILSALWIEDYTFAHWEKVKYIYRISAVFLGPTILLVVIVYMLYAAVVTIVRDRMSFWELPDWILAGFNAPPTKPKEEAEHDFPTVSP